ncbi:SAM-dependent methyltransferase [Oceanobacillus sp. E9]|uniref:class I SAM-dependent methyltransferase n=1 Tax=Oceanobacillus TaxID=182709 RepID=UPI00084E649D|nr:MULTISPECIES: class I SAM-dependent methyltransferase [Oceanobacillus]OEH54406.1 SAM-dependent methyltransferase [Oceanobacillus sp. E9]
MIPLVYDQLNRFGEDDTFFLSLLKEIKGKNLADLGCGTGRLTLHFAKAGFDITAIDPNKEAIELAKTKQTSNQVEWIIGDSGDLKTNTYDVVIMTANVAQVFLTDVDWEQVTSDVFRSLKEGGSFIFDTRNPKAEVWKKWMADKTPDIATHPKTGEELEIWTEYDGMDEKQIFTFYETVKSVKSGEVIQREKLQLRFRNQKEVKVALEKSGFSDVKCYGDWELKEASEESSSFIFYGTK